MSSAVNSFVPAAMAHPSPFIVPRAQASRATPVVFVVDNDNSVRESLELLISCEGWQPETFSSAHEFLARPRVSVPHCLILDVSLPDVNGLDLQKRVMERREMPIIFL